MDEWMSGHFFGGGVWGIFFKGEGPEGSDAYSDKHACVGEL